MSLQNKGFGRRDHCLQTSKMASTDEIHEHTTYPHSAASLLAVCCVPLSFLQAFIDTLGDPGRHKARLSEKFPSIKFVVVKKADSKFPIVSAASIVAKVRGGERWGWGDGKGRVLGRKREWGGRVDA